MRWQRRLSAVYLVYLQIIWSEVAHCQQVRDCMALGYCPREEFEGRAVARYDLTRPNITGRSCRSPPSAFDVQRAMRGIRQAIEVCSGTDGQRKSFLFRGYFSRGFVYRLEVVGLEPGPSASCIRDRVVQIAIPQDFSVRERDQVDCSCSAENFVAVSCG